jgi:hypothetical protein
MMARQASTRGRLVHWTLDLLHPRLTFVREDAGVEPLPEELELFATMFALPDDRSTL